MAIPEFKVPSFLAGQDAKTIHKRMMEALPPDIDDTEGGFPWDFTMPTALEKAELLEFHLVQTLMLMFPAWAWGEWLDLHARARGLTRKPPTAAYAVVEIVGTPGTQIPAGFRFAAPAVGDSPAVEFAVQETVYIAGDGMASIGVTAVEPGTGGNVPADTITIMARPIKGITSITNPERATGGTGEEDDESLRVRVDEFDSAAEASFVGCDGDYVRWAKEVPGVGDVYVIAQWDPGAPNSVKVVVIDANGDPANEQIVDAVYEHIMATHDRAIRKAPIGALVTVAPPTPVHITYTFVLQVKEGYEEGQVVDQLRNQVRLYYTEAKDDGMVRYNQIHALLTRTPGVADFTALTLNGDTENIPIGDDEYPVTAAINAQGGDSGE